VPPPDAPGPFSLSDPESIRSVLAAAGYTRTDLDAMTAPMWFGDSADGAYQLVLGLLEWMLEGVDGPGRARALNDLRATIAAHETTGGVLYESAVWIVRAQRP
jgi:hypothetical protein